MFDEHNYDIQSAFWYLVGTGCVVLFMISISALIWSNDGNIYAACGTQLWTIVIADFVIMLMQGIIAYFICSFIEQYQWDHLCVYCTYTACYILAFVLAVCLSIFTLQTIAEANNIPTCVTAMINVSNVFNAPLLANLGYCYAALYIFAAIVFFVRLVFIGFYGAAAL